MPSNTSAPREIKLGADSFWHLHTLKTIPVPLLVLSCVWMRSLML